MALIAKTSEKVSEPISLFRRGVEEVARHGADPIIETLVNDSDLGLHFPALAEQRRDFVRAELLANLKRHQLRVFYGSGTSSAMRSSCRVTAISETRELIRTDEFSFR